MTDLAFRARAIGPLARAIRDACGDDDQAFFDSLDGCTDVLEAASQAVRYRAELEADAGAMKALASVYGDRAKVLQERADGAKTALFHFMQEIGEKTLRLPEATLSVSAGKPNLIGEADPATLPDNLVRVKREPDKTAIRAELDAGGSVPGYSLSNAAPHLTVRAR